MTDLPNPEPQDAQEPSLRDVIRAAIAESTPAEDDGNSAELAPTDKLADKRSRDANGRFAPGTDTEKRQTLTLPDPKAKLATGEADKPAVEAAKAPESWPAALKAKFATVDPEVQKFLSEREAEIHRRFTSQDEDRKFGSEVKRMADPYLATIQAEGGDVKAAFKDYLNFSYIFRTGNPQSKLGALHHIAKMFNVPLALQQQPAGEASAFTQADISGAVQAEIKRQRENDEHSRMLGEIEAFRKAPGHEHFDRLKPVIVGLLQSPNAPDADPLTWAYNEARWADPELRSTLQMEANRGADGSSKADAARRAKVSVTGGPGGAVAQSANGADRSLRDELRANMRATMGRV
jgi:hypothetical protein